MDIASTLLFDADQHVAFSRPIGCVSFVLFDNRRSARNTGPLSMLFWGNCLLCLLLKATLE